MVDLVEAKRLGGCPLIVAMENCLLVRVGIVQHC
jgi:hypothetical protein